MHYVNRSSAKRLPIWWKIPRVLPAAPTIFSLPATSNAVVTMPARLLRMSITWKQEKGLRSSEHLKSGWDPVFCENQIWILRQHPFRGPWDAFRQHFPRVFQWKPVFFLSLHISLTFFRVISVTLLRVNRNNAFFKPLFFRGFNTWLIAQFFPD